MRRKSRHALRSCCSLLSLIIHELGLKETKENYWELTCNTYIYMYKNSSEKLYWQTETKNLI